MVAQDSLSSDDLDDTRVTFGLQNSDNFVFEKVHYENLFKQETSTEEEMSCSEPRRTANETPHAAGHPGENTIFSEQSMWYSEANEKSAFWGQLDEKNNGQKLIKKESGEDEIICPTDKNSDLQESNQTTHHNPFIGQEMDNSTTIENEDTSETSNWDSEKEKFRKFLYA